jgi:hypothetical protein
LDPAASAYTYQENPLPGTKQIDFKVGVAPGRTVNRVALIRNGSTTHAFNPDQRYVELRMLLDEPAIETNARHLVVETPANAYWAPPGYYLLTVVDDQGLPVSLAHWIRLQ